MAVQPLFASFPTFGAFAVRQYWNLWAGGPLGGESFRLPVHYRVEHLLALFSSLALFLFWGLQDFVCVGCPPWSPGGTGTREGAKPSCRGNRW